MTRDSHLDRYTALKNSGSSAPEVYQTARQDGLSRLEAVRVLRSLFHLSLEAAMKVVSAIEGPRAGELPVLRDYAGLEQVLREELAYCGCDHYEEAVYLLRDVLRGARDWEDALPSHDEERLTAARQGMLERLGYERNPGLATWFLYWLDHRDLVWHGSRASDCGITRKGRWLLEALERLYPPPRPSDE